MKFDLGNKIIEVTFLYFSLSCYGFIRIVLRWWTETHVWQKKGCSAMRKSHQSHRGSFGKKKRTTWTACPMAQVIIPFFTRVASFSLPWFFSFVELTDWLKGKAPFFCQLISSKTKTRIRDVCFPALGIGYIFSRAWRKLHFSTLDNSYTCFPALLSVTRFCSPCDWLMAFIQCDFWGLSLSSSSLFCCCC